MPATPDDSAARREELTRLVRDESARVVATLVRTTGSWTLAEDAVQDAVVRALETWPRDGVPPHPRAWLTVTARRCAIDQLRREAARAGKEAAAMADLEPIDAPLPEDSVVRDDLLRLLFTCCHPALPVASQTALALRTLCGLTTAEVASALLVTEPTMTKRLTRARHKIAVAHIPYRTPTPEELPVRLRGVLTTIYLLFNEGYQATSGDGPLRRALTAEAIRLAQLLDDLLPGQVSVLGLRALMHLHNARGPSRLNDEGEPVRLPEQDRTRWDHGEINRGLELLGVALRHSTAGPDSYVVQAAIAACHDLARTWEETNWEAIVSWYDVLLVVDDTPVVRLNRAVAIGELHGAPAGLVEMDQLEGLDGYLPYVAGRAELLARAGEIANARKAYQDALALPTNAATRRALMNRLEELA